MCRPIWKHDIILFTTGATMTSAALAWGQALINTPHPHISQTTPGRGRIHAHNRSGNIGALTHALLLRPYLLFLFMSSLQTHPYLHWAIPKKYKPDKWRLIVDLSSPKGYSVNDAIASELCSVSYTSVDRAVDFVRHLGEGCLLAKLDLKEAYRAVPVHPSDQRLLAVSWQGTTYLDRALPFGLRSAPKLFSALTDAMMWMLYERGIETALHYLDDFLILGPAGSPLCGQALQTTLTLCDELGFPVAPEKLKVLQPLSPFWASKLTRWRAKFTSHMTSWSACSPRSTSG